MATFSQSLAATWWVYSAAATATNGSVTGSATDFEAAVTLPSFVSTEIDCVLTVAPTNKLLICSGVVACSEEVELSSVHASSA